MKTDNLFVPHLEIEGKPPLDISKCGSYIAASDGRAAGVWEMSSGTQVARMSSGGHLAFSTARIRRIDPSSLTRMG